jgi:hypothetical protein
MENPETLSHRLADHHPKSGHQHGQEKRNTDTTGTPKQRQISGMV